MDNDPRFAKTGSLTVAVDVIDVLPRADCSQRAGNAQRDVVVRREQIDDPGLSGNTTARGPSAQNKIS